MQKQYKIIRLPKGNGNYRTIYAPSKAYKTKLKSFLYDLQQKVHNADEEQVSHGFIRGRGPVTNALKHVGYTYTLSLDLKDFFDSVTLDMVQEYLSEEEKRLCFIDGIARQGLPTSPLMANLAFLKLDTAIKDAIAEVGAYAVYTRYADDLIFSFNQEGFEKDIEEVVARIVSAGGFKLNDTKRTLQSSHGGRRMITGISVGERNIAPSRKLKRRIRAALHQKNREQSFGLLSWAACKEPQAFYTDRDLLNKNIFEEDALDLSNDFFLSNLLSFEEYVALVEGDFESKDTVHEQDRAKWEKQKEAFLAQRTDFYEKERSRVKAEQKKSRKKIEEQLNPPEQEKKKAKPSAKKMSRPLPSSAQASAQQESISKELAVDLEVLKEVEQVEAVAFQNAKKQRRRIKEEQQQEHAKEEEKKRSMNKVFMASLLPIVLVIAAMSYFFGNTEVEVKPTYPLFVKPTPYDARIQILNIKPKYTMGIELKPGRYDIRISKKGYKSQRFWITMEHEPIVIERELVKIKRRKVY